MNFINFAKTESRLKEGAYGQKYYSPNQEKSKVVSPKASESKSESKANSRTPTRGNAGGMKVARKRNGSGSNVFKKVSDVSGGAYKGMVKRRNELGTKVGKAIQGVAGKVRGNPLKTGLGLAVAGGLGYAAAKALQNRKSKSIGDRINANPLIKKLRKMRSDKGRKRK